MKKLLLLLPCLLFAASGVQAKRPIRQTPERVAAMIYADDFYSLDVLTPDEYNDLPKQLQLLTDAILGSRFNDLPKSCKAIETLLNEHIAELDGPMQSRLFGMLLGNLRMMGEYEQAAGIAAMLRDLTAADDDASKATLNSMERWFGALAQYPKTSIKRPEGDITLPAYVVSERIRNALGEPTEIRTLYTDVQIGDTTERFIFDTGCSQASFVSEDFAQRHNIRIICDSILISGASAKGYARVGILDSMRVGPVTVYHPTFIITPPNEEVDTLYKVNAVLGTDFMNLVGEIQIYPREERMVIPAVPSTMPSWPRNLSLDCMSGQYSVRMACDSETVVMRFDTGSTHTTMSPLWFAKHKKRVQKEGKHRPIGIGGFGGTTRGYGYEMPSLRFDIGPDGCVMHGIVVYSDIRSSLPESHDGWLGVDYFLNFDKVTINFDRMFVTAELARPAAR